jgi:hypothetical protein
MDMVKMELNILREEKINGFITRAKAKWQVVPKANDYQF